MNNSGNYPSYRRPITNQPYSEPRHCPACGGSSAPHAETHEERYKRLMARLNILERKDA